MAADTTTLVLDLVEWVSVEPRPYAEVMDAWRTSCPRLPIWEDAVDRGLVSCERDAGLGTVVKVTPRGLSVLRREGRLPSPSPAPTAGAAAPS